VCSGDNGRVVDSPFAGKFENRVLLFDQSRPIAGSLTFFDEGFRKTCFGGEFGLRHPGLRANLVDGAASRRDGGGMGLGAFNSHLPIIQHYNAFVLLICQKFLDFLGQLVRDRNASGLGLPRCVVDGVFVGEVCRDIETHKMLLKIGTVTVFNLCKSRVLHDVFILCPYRAILSRVLLKASQCVCIPCSTADYKKREG
jgi:hypothetical protein